IGRAMARACIAGINQINCAAEMRADSCLHAYATPLCLYKDLLLGVEDLSIASEYLLRTAEGKEARRFLHSVRVKVAEKGGAEEGSAAEQTGADAHKS